MQAATANAVRTPSRPSIHFHAAHYGEFPFPQSFRKRKRSSNYSSDDELADTPFAQQPHSPNVSSPDDSEGDHRNKRARIQRRTHIEHGMNGLTLQNQVSPVSSSGASFAASSVTGGSQSQYGANAIDHPHYVSEPELLEIDEAFRPREVEFDSNIGTPQVEEVPSPTALKNDIDDVKMKGTSWFEPEKDRIIITDIDDYDSEEEPKAPTPPPELAQYWDEEEQRYKPFEISPAYLRHIGSIPKPVAFQRNPKDSLALIAYRPPPVIFPQRPDAVEEPEFTDYYQPEQTVSQNNFGDDAMEIDEE